MIIVLFCQQKVTGTGGTLSTRMAQGVVTVVEVLHHKYLVVPGNLCSSLLVVKLHKFTILAVTSVP